jgi:hypothetical protein
MAFQDVATNFIRIMLPFQVDGFKIGICPLSQQDAGKSPSMSISVSKMAKFVELLVNRKKYLAVHVYEYVIHCTHVYE